MKKQKQQAFCVHGHFYQPPREDPLTGEIPIEPGAAPYNNWNERIHMQCYSPNAKLENFAHISFNIGPTLVDWMVSYDPGTLARIVEQDQRNLKDYGVGNAMAQSYNHTILPLSSLRDKYTQVLWGIADFEYYFEHKPQGMWLPEAAVDRETLQVLAECGIEFVILAPWQADTENLDVTQPYIIPLDNGKRISAFFYHQDISGRISFDPTLTENADKFITDVLLPQYTSDAKSSKQAQLVLVASDGELYGHHQPFRDQFLSRLMDGALRDKPLEATYPALWLKQYPPQEMMTIREKTSWSCYHGVTRWMGECGCTPHAEWKAPLRQAMNKVAEAVDQVYLDTLQPLMADPWKLRNEYIHVVNKRTKLVDLVSTQVGRRVEGDELRKIGGLLAAQYERQRMFTSCGWYFDDFDRIEPRNNVAYAAAAVWLTNNATGLDLSSAAMEYFREVKSWRSGMWGSTVFRHFLEQAQKKQPQLN